MNRGYRVYIKEGKLASKATFKNKGNIWRFYTFLMVKMLSTLLLPLAPVINLAEVRITKMAKDEHYIDFAKAIKSSDKPKNYWTMFVSCCFKYFYVLGTILVIILGTGLLLAFGYLVSLYLDTQLELELISILPILFAVPGIIALVVYLITLFVRYVPNGYIVDSNDELDASKVLDYSLNALKKTGKMTLFASYFMELLNHVVRIVIIFVAWFAVSEILEESALALLVVGVLIGIYVLNIPKIATKFKVFRYCLFEDVVYDQLIANKKVSGIAIKDVTTSKKPTSQQLLNQIFSNDNSEEQQVAKMSALLNMNNLYPTVEKTKEEVEAEILATPVEKFDLSNSDPVEQNIEETNVEENNNEETGESVNESVEEVEVNEEPVVTEEIDSFEEPSIVEELQTTEEPVSFEENNSVEKVETTEELETFEEPVSFEEINSFEEVEATEELETFEEPVVFEENNSTEEAELVEELQTFEEPVVFEENNSTEEAELVEELETFDEPVSFEEDNSAEELELVEELETFDENNLTEELELVEELETFEENNSTEEVEMTEESISEESSNEEGNEELEIFDESLGE